MKECTFKPKIGRRYFSKKEKEKNESNNNNEEKKNRMVELYEKGIADIKKKKNRTKEEMEVEKQIKELTFHPRTKKEEVNIETRSNDIYNEKEYKDLYERLKFGRMERLVKDSAHDRYDLNKDLKKFVKKSKENKNREFLEEEKFQDELIESTNIVKNSQKNEKNQSNKKNISGNKKEEVNNNSFEPSSEEDGEKKEGIPLLIIDVNIRQGVKKRFMCMRGILQKLLLKNLQKNIN